MVFFSFFGIFMICVFVFFFFVVFGNFVFTKISFKLFILIIYVGNKMYLYFFMVIKKRRYKVVGYKGIFYSESMYFVGLLSFIVFCVM